MDFPSLDALSPIDGRYRKVTAPIADHFSEASIIRYRIQVEVEYFIALCKIPLLPVSKVTDLEISKLKSLYENFNIKYAQEVKDIESETNHDVKAIEIFLRRKFDELGLSEHKEYIHFGLTSQDINNTAFPLALKNSHKQIVYPTAIDILCKVKELAIRWQAIPMLARTHGQPASPTFVGKELYVFYERLNYQLNYFDQIPFGAKFGGATGNMNAHYITFPDVDWKVFANHFTEEQLGLKRQQITTQIEHYDNMAAYFDTLKRVNTILIDLCRDCWTYISMDYFKQKIVDNEVGSSTMPHKVNPIDFENAEGNLGLANALLEHLSAKLPISRLQRDLTDSTVIRNIGVPLGHSLIAYKSLLKGLGKIILNEEKISKDLDENWAVVAEAIQTILRRENFPDPYKVLKSLTRTHGAITAKTMADFILSLDISEEVKEELLRITPHNYTGRFMIE